MNNSPSLNELPLPGLREDNPRDFLAALGLFRLIDMVFPELEATLKWNPRGGNPVLLTSKPLACDWSERILKPLQELAEPLDSVLFHGPIIKTEPAVYRKAVSRAHAFAKSDHVLARLPMLVYASYAGQMVDENDGMVEPTAFSFANGQGGKNLLKDVRELIVSLQPETLEAGLASRDEPIAAKSFRWNPVEFRPSAYRSHDPGKKLKGDQTLDHPVFNVLAFFGLTFYPSVPTASGSETLGFSIVNKQTCFCWPIWGDPLRPDVVQTLANLFQGSVSLVPGVLRQWQSTRFSSDKSLYFAPAVLAS